jgi:hypothetical protein
VESRDDSNRYELKRLEENLKDEINLEIPMKLGVHSMPQYDGPIEFLATLGKEINLGEEINEDSNIIYWLNVSLDDFQRIAQSLREAYGLTGASDAAETINGHILAIKDFVEKSPGLNMIFGESIGNIAMTGHEEAEATQYKNTSQYLFKEYHQGSRIKEYKEAEKERIEEERRKIGRAHV